MTTTLPAPTLNVHSDPCSFDYIKGYKMAPPTGPSSSDSNDGATHQSKNGFFSRLFRHKPAKKTLTKTKQAGFVMPYERKSPQPQPSTRSRLNKTKMAGQTTTSVPAMTVTLPSVKGRTSLQIHTYDGNTEPAARGDTVRFSHPAVVAVRARTPSAGSQMLLDTWDAVSILSSIPPSEAPSPDESTASLPEVSLILPKTVWRNSGQFRAADGELASFAEFKARFDGHPTLASDDDDDLTPTQTSRHPPSLQFIPTVGTFNISDEPVFRVDEPVSKTEGSDATQIEQNRDSALDMLESGGVPAVIPAVDIPESAVPVLSKQYPAALTPPQYPQSLIPGGTQRPFSFPASMTEREIYRAYRPEPTIATALSQDTNRKLAVPTFLNGPRPKTPNFFGDTTGHRQHYSCVESGLFESVAEAAAAATPATSRKPVKKHNHSKSANTLKPLPPTPTSAATADSNIPTPHKMNSNRYPIIDPSIAARFSTEARYERRTIDDIEAKFVREHGKKADKKTSTAAAASTSTPNGRPVSSMTLDRHILEGLEEERAQLEQKIAVQQAKVAAKKQKQKGKGKTATPELIQKQKKIDEGLKRLMH